MKLKHEQQKKNEWLGIKRTKKKEKERNSFYFVSKLNFKEKKQLFKYHSVDLINTNRTYIYLLFLSLWLRSIIKLQQL